MPAVIIQIDGWDPATSAAVTIRACSHNDPSVCHLDGKTWWPVLSKLPALRYDLFDGSFGTSITAPSSDLTLSIEPWTAFARYSLADAQIQLWTGEPGAPFTQWTRRMVGRLSEQPQIASAVASISFAVDDSWLDTPLLALYAGTTGAEGEAAQKGTPKPLALGAPRYVPGVMIDSVNTILQLSSYGAVQGVDVALEKLSRFSPSVGNYATFADLKAATIPPGRWATCLSAGLVRHGAPIEGQSSYLMRGDKAGSSGWVRLPGAIIRRIAEIAGAGERVSAASLAALDITRPWPLSLWLDQQVTPRALIQRIAASVNAVAGVSWLGELFVVPIDIGAALATLNTDGSSLPQVGDVSQVVAGKPFWRLALQAERTWQVHALGDVAFTAPLLERGRYDPAETYREGNIVDLEDGSRWLYTATTPTAGNAPSTDSAFWSSLSAPIRATYDDGTPVEELKPAQPGADVTDDAYKAAAGQTIKQTIVSIDSLITKAADLETMYGDTANASASAALASQAAQASQTAQSNAETAATATTAAMTKAVDAAKVSTDASQSAERSQALAATASDSARGSATAAEGNASSAAASVDSAGKSASSAEASATSASTFAGNAQGFAGQAATSASQASTSATNADGSANTASSYMQQAASSRDAAGGSAGAAASSASIAKSASDTASSQATSATTAANNAYNQYLGAVGQAQAASSSAALASASAAAASQSASLVASVATSAINSNSDFNAWSNASGLPDSWKFWTNSDNTSRVAGVLGRPYAVRQSPAAGERLGFYQDGQRMTRGWCILEARIRGYNSFSGAGVRFSGAGKSYDLNFATDPDAAGTVRSGAENAGWSYNYSKLIYVTAEDYGAVLYAFTAYDGLGDISAQKQIDWDHVAVRTATDGEIAGKRADGNATTALAQIATNASAQASQNAAQAIVNTNVNTTLNNQSAVNSNLSQAIANTYAAASQQISTLSAYAATNQNYAPALTSWSLPAGYSVLTSANVTGWTWGTAVVGSMPGTGEFALGVSSKIYMTPNQNVTFSADLLCFGDGNQYVKLNILTFDSNGTLLDDRRGPDCRTSNFDDSRPRSTNAVTAYLGSNAAYCVLRILGQNASTAANPAGFRRAKFEAGGIATAYSEEGAAASLSASIQVLQAATTDVQNRISTAVFQVLAQAGTSRALLKLGANGYGASQIDLVASGIRLLAQSSDDPTQAIEALTVRSNGQVDIPNLLTNFSVVPAFGYFNGPRQGAGPDPGTSGGNPPTPIRDIRRSPQAIP